MLKKLKSKLKIQILDFSDFFNNKVEKCGQTILHYCFLATFIIKNNFFHSSLMNIFLFFHIIKISLRHLKLKHFCNQNFAYFVNISLTLNFNFIYIYLFCFFFFINIISFSIPIISFHICINRLASSFFLNFNIFYNFSIFAIFVVLI